MRKKPTKRELQAIGTRKKIFESAWRLFSEKGFDNVTMGEITSAVGLTPGTFYRYFRTKQEILAIVYNQLDGHYQEFYEQEILSDKYQGIGSLERLKVFTTHNLESCVKDGLEYINVIYRYMAQSDAFEKSMNNPDRIYFKIVRSLIEEGQQKGEIRSDLPHVRILSDLIMLTRGCIVDWELNKRPGSIGDWSDSLIDCYLEGIRQRSMTDAEGGSGTGDA